MLFILVNYFNEEEVIDFILNQLARQELNGLRIVVVDNGSRDSNLLDSELRKDKRVKVLFPGKNLGYLGAAAFALNEFLKSNPYPDFVVLSNADLKFENSRCLINLIECSPMEADIVGPNLISSRNYSHLNPFYNERIQKGKLKFLITVFSFYPLYILYQCLALSSGLLNDKNGASFAGSRYVYAIHGAMMVFRKSYFEKGGNLSFGSFLFGEELYVAELARRHEMKIFYNAEVKLIHHQHSTTGAFKKPLYVIWMRNSLAYILKTFFND